MYIDGYRQILYHLYKGFEHPQILGSTGLLDQYPTDTEG